MLSRYTIVVNVVVDITTVLCAKTQINGNLEINVDKICINCQTETTSCLKRLQSS